MKATDLEVPFRVKNAILHALDNYHVEDDIYEFSKLSEQQLLRVRNFGQVSINQLSRALGEWGLKLGHFGIPALEQEIECLQSRLDKLRAEKDRLSKLFQPK